MQFSDENNGTRSSTLAHENTKCSVVFERSYSYYGLQPLAARLPELALKLERIDCSRWFY